MLRAHVSRMPLAWLSMGMITLLWEATARLALIPAFLLPAPSHVLLRLSQELVTTMLWNHMLTTAWVAMTGVSVAILLGVTCGWLFYHHGRVAQLFQWMLTASQSLPVVAVAPLILLWIPHPFWARTTVATIITIYPVFAATYTALQVIPRELREVAHLNGASRLALLRYVEFPLALPVMLSGIQTSVVLALTGAVVGEYLGGRDGLGALINIARGLFDTTLVFVALVVLVAMTLLAYAGIHLVQQRVAQTFE